MCKEELSTAGSFGVLLIRGKISTVMISPRRARKMQRMLKHEMQQQTREKLEGILKPKPKFMPWPIWKYLINLLLDLPN